MMGWRGGQSPWLQELGDPGWSVIPSRVKEALDKLPVCVWVIGSNP